MRRVSDTSSGFYAEERPETVKCVLVGDGAVGKTSLIVSYTTDGYPTEYLPTAFDNFSVDLTADGRPLRLQLCDTAGQEDFDGLRPLCYPHTDVFLLCFSVVSPSSFANLREKWLPELMQYRGHAPLPILLVGTQSDLRTDVKVLIELSQRREKPISEAEANKLANEMKATYVECSALTQKNLKEVFDNAVVSALEARRRTVKRSLSSGYESQCSKSKYLPAEYMTSNAEESGTFEQLNNRSRRRFSWKGFCCFASHTR